MVFLKAKWIVPKEYKDIKTVNVFHKEQDKTETLLPDNLKNLHIGYRKVLKLEKNKNIRIRVTADDYYKFYCNGRLVGMGPAQGYFFDYYWNEYDLTDFLNTKENELFFDVYYHGLISRSYCSGDGRIGLIAEITDGSGKVLEYTDESWECGRIAAYTGQKVIGYDTSFAENYDSRLENIKYEPASLRTGDHIFHDTAVDTLAITEKAPVHTEKLPGGGYFYDFGEEITGHIKITAEGKAGQTVRILHGEETEDTPLKVRYKMRCSCVCDETWTLRQGENTRTQYDYKAFRYAAVIPEDGVKIKHVSVVVRHWRFDDAFCTLETNDADLKKVWEICKSTVKYGAQETFVDCPMREKGQYAGDLTIMTAAHLVLTKDASLTSKAIENQAQSAAVCKGLLAVTPGSLMQEIADYSLQFPLLALTHYKCTNDLRFLKKNLETSKEMIAHFEKYQREDGLLAGVDDKWNLVDWPENLRDGYDFPLLRPMDRNSPPHNVINAFFIGAVLKTEEINNILDIPCEKKSKGLIEAFNRAFLNADTGLYTDSESTLHSSLHSNVLPLFYGFCPKNSVGKICDLLLEKGFCCGVYMSYFVLKALCKAGRYEDAYRLIVNKSEHSWLNMVSEGATTCFEAWGKDQKWNTSLCHPWACAPISVLAEDILPNMPHLGHIVYKER